MHQGRGHEMSRALDRWMSYERSPNMHPGMRYGLGSVTGLLRDESWV